MVDLRVAESGRFGTLRRALSLFIGVRRVGNTQRDHTIRTVRRLIWFVRRAERIRGTAARRRTARVLGAVARRHVRRVARAARASSLRVAAASGRRATTATSTATAAAAYASSRRPLPPSGDAANQRSKNCTRTPSSPRAYRSGPQYTPHGHDLLGSRERGDTGENQDRARDAPARVTFAEEPRAQQRAEHDAHLARGRDDAHGCEDERGQNEDVAER